MMKLAVFASGTGSNFDAIVHAIQNGELDAEVTMLVCDRVGAPVIEKAQNYEIDTIVFSANVYESKAQYEEALLKDCRERGIDYIILAGFMRLIGPTLLEPYRNRILNIHPSLLPAFPGKDAIGQAFDQQVKITGVTVHFVDEGMDTGPIIEQEAVRIEDGDTKDDVVRKIQAIEHKLYPSVIRTLKIKEESI
ncbi:phosphoribosylglycinamide formyltransferase [Halobacillus yeomjeoni]|uniref:Phosphoribosylglycinamide formyltransferase n=1 Tax=Halobacillus yeomjeoni TaxID=311194 RepID=A0A931HXV5_9BACI|nr:phosphoribosylglycinamide formyltransferase [Halobacillus yeomjeoni]MBH0231456.1 phosphoribosylglycinamide formyltransferase [Halobacillus yeomjeoni]